MKGMGLVSRSAGALGDVFAASASGDAGILRLAPLPFAQQAQSLADRDELSAALEMASLVPSSQVCIWKQRICSASWQRLVSSAVGSLCLIAAHKA